MNTFGQKLKAYRNNTGMTQGQLGKLIGVSKSALSTWEHDSVTPSIAKVQKVCIALNIKIDDLLGGTENDSDNENAESIKPVTDEEIKFALYGTTDITDDMYDAIKDFAETQLNRAKREGKL